MVQEWKKKEGQFMETIATLEEQLRESKKQ